MCWGRVNITLMSHVLPTSGRKDLFTLVLSELLCGRLIHRIVEPAHFVFSYAGQQNNLINLI